MYFVGKKTWASMETNRVVDSVLWLWSLLFNTPNKWRVHCVFVFVGPRSVTGKDDG